MKSKFIKDYITGERIGEVFMLSQKQLLTNKNGNYYLSLKLCDKSGDIDGKKWDTTENEYDRLVEGSFYEIKGSVTDFQGISQFRIDSIVPASGEYKADDFMKSSPRDMEEMKKELKEYIDSMKDENCKKLLSYFFDDQKFYKQFTESPAAKALHHAYVGGLLEHTLEVCKLADGIAQIYPFIKRDILVMGAILHDIGKIKEYSAKASIDFTTEGHLIGHLVIGAMMVSKACNELNLDELFTIHTEHMILSHHGKYEYGSPKRPKSLEAILLHYADDISAGVTQFVDATRDNPEELFTRNNRTTFERKLFKGYIKDYFEPEKEEKDEKPEKYDDFLSFFENYDK